MNVFASTLISGLLIFPSVLAGAETLELHSRFRQPVAEGSDAYTQIAQTVNWDAKKKVAELKVCPNALSIAPCDSG